MARFLLKTLVVVLVGMVLTVGHALAGTVTVTVKNLTNGLYFTPLLVTVHDKNTHLFELGSPASQALQAMAEGGDISMLSALAGGPDRDTVENPAGGLLAPGGIVSDIDLGPSQRRNRYLSLVAMMLPTNDGFVGLDSVPIPRASGGTGVSASDSNTKVHIHRGVIGDNDAEGGFSDVDSTIHRWLNPVAEVVIKVKRRHHKDD